MSSGNNGGNFVSAPMCKEKFICKYIKCHLQKSWHLVIIYHMSTLWFYIRHFCMSQSEVCSYPWHWTLNHFWWLHYDDVIMGAMASQITSLTIVNSTVYLDADQREHQSPASLAFVRGIHRGPVNSPHKWPVTRKMFPFDDVIMTHRVLQTAFCVAWVLRALMYRFFIHLHFQNTNTSLIFPWKMWQ